MRILLIGTSLDYNNQSYGNLAGFNHGYGAAFRELGHQVDSIHHRQVPTYFGGKYDVMLLRDVTVDPTAIGKLTFAAKKFGMFTHAEFIQAKTMDVKFFEALKERGRLPDHIFYDQPLAAQRYAELGIDVPGTFLGWGANPACHARPWEEKDIDVAWFGHAYGERQMRVENLIFPLKELEKEGFRVLIHGRGQPDGPVSLPEMFELMSRTRIVVRISHKAHWEGGYSGRTIHDASASGCFVVHDEYPTCRDMFPHAHFVPVEKVREAVLEMIESPGHCKNQANLGYLHVRNNHMTTHHAQRMLEILDV